MPGYHVPSWNGEHTRRVATGTRYRFTYTGENRNVEKKLYPL